MKKRIKLCLPTGLLIFLIYQIVNHIVTIPDQIGYPMCIVSIIFMLIGIAFSGRSLGKQITTK